MSIGIIHLIALKWNSGLTNDFEIMTASLNYIKRIWNLSIEYRQITFKYEIKIKQPRLV
jgi:hypothetical protein